MKKILIPVLCSVLFSTTVSAQKTTVAPTKLEAVKSKLTPKEVIDNYFKALGGKAQLEAIKSVITDNTLSVQGMEITMVTKKMGNKFKSVQNVMGQEVTSLFDGEKGYIDQMGTKRDIPADQVVELKKGKTVEALLIDSSKFTSATVESIEGKQYNVLTSDKGKTYFDAATGLLYKTDSPDGKMIIKNYLTVDGIKFPQEVEAEAKGQKVSIKTTKVVINSGVSDADFK